MELIKHYFNLIKIYIIKFPKLNSELTGLSILSVIYTYYAGPTFVGFNIKE